MSLCKDDRGLMTGLQPLPAYMLQGGTNLSPQVSLDWPGSESSTVQSREGGRGGEEGVEGWESTALMLTLPHPPQHVVSCRQENRQTLTPRTN